jgi:probable F420-dependent oxidoreductase
MAKAEFGVRLPVAGPLAGPGPIKRVAKRAEELGFDALWVHDFIAWTSYQDRTHVSCGSLEAVEAAGPDQPPIFFESITNLAFLAALTDRIRLGVAVLCLPFRNPIIAAKQVACIDVLSGGRLILGIGVGAAKVTHNVDFEVLGISRADKYDRTKDYFRAMRAVWTESAPSYEGTFISFPETQIDPKPVQKPFPPVWVGGGGPKSVDIAAEFATGWLPPWVSPEEYPARIQGLYDAAAAKGRSDVEFDIATEVYVCVARTREEAVANSRHTLSVLTEGFADDATPEAIQAAGLVGSTDDVNEKLRRYVDAGVKHYEMKFVYHTVDHLLEQLELFQQEIMPNFREPAAAGAGG